MMSNIKKIAMIKMIKEENMEKRNLK